MFLSLSQINKKYVHISGEDKKFSSPVILLL